MVDTLSSMCIDVVPGNLGTGTGRGHGPGLAGPLASPEATSMHIDDISTMASPFPQKSEPPLANPTFR